MDWIVSYEQGIKPEKWMWWKEQEAIPEMQKLSQVITSYR